MKKSIKRLNQIGEIAAWLAIVEAIFLIASIYLAPIKSWTSYLVAILLITASPFLTFSQGLVPLITGRMRVNVAFIYEFEAPTFFARLIGLVHIMLGVLALLLGLVCLIIWLS
ncbi:hypothetical protein I8748_22935 [Nostoc sp. CENA67]|uniref:Uncharacterized protein n=1 Tax=Amazonocrinis nigriterrae CENA67 TaxID=2794033 RepID=A0A8J7HRX2_9NOST|nr:hypothetical protein [Amazonocrinis nigriterrae]MBH8565003.1 hypothetical protein [Amazonocrinis nigriterrae CENA67]